MVQGLVNSGLYQSFSKKTRDEKPRKEKKNNSNEIREWFRIKWKIIVSATILLVSILISSGVILYLNFNPSGENHCRKGYLNVHIIPYMYSNADQFVSPHENGVYESFDFVINELNIDDRRRFTLSETYLLWNWWKNQTNSVKKLVQKLLDEGRLEIAGGGWCISDEALVHYTSFIDQFTWGLRCLREIAGRQVAPDVSFLMDNRGHSREIGFLLNEMDFRAVMLGGVSQHEQCYRRTYQKMEFLWSDGGIFGNRREKPNLFTSILDDRALKINSLFEYENPVIDINEFYSNVMCQVYGFSTNHVFVPVGSHFRLKNTKSVFRVIESIKNLTRYNSKLKMNVIYSTPSYYISSVEKSNKRWRRSFGEFLPYSKNKFEFWTGYYSSRPSLKFLERLTNRFLQVLKQMLSNSNLRGCFSNNLTHLTEALGISQHHSLGVANQNTADYLYNLLCNSLSSAAEAANYALNIFAAKNSDFPKLKHESCLGLNISECKVTEESESFILTIYNPSNRYVNQYVRIPITRDVYLVKTGDGTSLRTQIVNIPEQILSVPGRKSRAKKELIFRAKRIPALGYKSFYITAADKIFNETKFASEKNIGLMINDLTGRISGIQRKKERYPMSQELLFYTSWMSRNSVLKPDGRPNIIARDVHTELLNEGELVTEYKQEFASWASQLVRIYKDEDFIEFKWIVGPIPISFFDGKEVITYFTTNIKSKDLFYVDVNGRGFERRQRGPELENESTGEFIARNYCPVNSQITITDKNYSLHIFNDRVQGGASVFEGELELMVHRRLSGLNLFARNEGDLNEKAYGAGLVATGQHWVFLGSAKDINLQKSIETFAAKAHWEPWYFFANASHTSYENWTKNYVTEFYGVKKELPKHLRILSLEPWKEDEILLRLENIGDDCSRVNVNIQKLFSGFVVKKAEEVTLAGNFFKAPLTSDTKFSSNPFVAKETKIKPTNFQIFIRPSEIKTYILEIEPLHRQIKK